MSDSGSIGIVLCSENKGADQMCDFCAADPRAHARFLLKNQLMYLLILSNMGRMARTPLSSGFLIRSDMNRRLLYSHRKWLEA